MTLQEAVNALLSAKKAFKRASAYGNEEEAGLALYEAQVAFDKAYDATSEDERKGYQSLRSPEVKTA